MGTGKAGKFFVHSVVTISEDVVDFVPTLNVDDIRHRYYVDVIWKANDVKIEAPWGWANRLEKLSKLQHYQEYLDIMTRINLSTFQNSCHFEAGKRDEISVVLSCPGNKELQAGYPAAGVTGKNIGIFFDQLDAKSNLSWKRKDITITNSWSRPESEHLTGRTEATTKEVLEQKNLIRLWNEIKDTKKVIVTFGKNANLAIKELISQGLISNSIKIIEMPHFSTRYLNSNIQSTEVDPQKRNIDRIKKLISLNNIQV